MRGRWFFSGYVLGAITAVAFSAFAARVVGYDGHLIGWDVLLGGSTICSDPYIWTATQEIECD